MWTQSYVNKRDETMVQLNMSVAEAETVAELLRSTQDPKAEEAVMKLADLLKSEELV